MATLRSGKWSLLLFSANRRESGSKGRICLKLQNVKMRLIWVNDALRLAESGGRPGVGAATAVRCFG